MPKSVLNDCTNRCEFAMGSSAEFGIVRRTYSACATYDLLMMLHLGPLRVAMLMQL